MRDCATSGSSEAVGSSFGFFLSPVGVTSVAGTSGVSVNFFEVSVFKSAGIGGSVMNLLF